MFPLRLFALFTIFYLLKHAQRIPTQKISSLRSSPPPDTTTTSLIMRAFLKLAIQLFSEPVLYKDLDAIYIFTETPDNEAPMWERVLFIRRDLQESEASRIPEFWLTSESGACGGWYIEAQTGRNVTVFRGSESLQRTFQEAWIRSAEVRSAEKGDAEQRPPSTRMPTLRTVPGMCDKKLNILRQHGTRTHFAPQGPLLSAVDHSRRRRRVMSFLLIMSFSLLKSNCKLVS